MEVVVVGKSKAEVEAEAAKAEAAEKDRAAEDEAIAREKDRAAEDEAIAREKDRRKMEPDEDEPHESKGKLTPVETCPNCEADVRFLEGAGNICRMCGTPLTARQSRPRNAFA